MGRKKIILISSAIVAVIIAAAIIYFQKGGRYEATVARLGMNSTAHLMCSCMYVSQNTEEFCRDYAALKQVKPWIRVDEENKEVDARLYLIFSGKARYRGLRMGCEIL